MTAWLLNHPTRASWVLIELLRPLKWRRRLSNAWWQLRHYDDKDAWRCLWETYEIESHEILAAIRDTSTGAALQGSPTETE